MTPQPCYISKTSLSQTSTKIYAKITAPILCFVLSRHGLGSCPHVGSKSGQSTSDWLLRLYPGWQSSGMGKNCRCGHHKCSSCYKRHAGLENLRRDRHQHCRVQRHESAGECIRAVSARPANQYHRKSASGNSNRPQRRRPMATDWQFFVASFNHLQLCLG